MEKIFSARLDEAALDEMERVTRRLKMTKRRFLEEAIHLRAQQLGGGGTDVCPRRLAPGSGTSGPMRPSAGSGESFGARSRDIIGSNVRVYVDSDILIWHLRGEPKAAALLRTLAAD